MNRKYAIRSKLTAGSLVIWLLLALAPACRKYADLSPLPQPAYLRVFNSIRATPTFQRPSLVMPFLTFMLDPVFDAGHLPDTAAIVGDFLAPRNQFSVSYPIDAGNTVAGSGTTNYEYPGRIHVPTAPSINGFDLSAWGQIPSGRHRILFVARPQSDTIFSRLYQLQRSMIIIDTTFDFQAGEVYTLEALLADLDRVKYVAYLRKEEFTREHYSADSVYAKIYNRVTRIDTTTPLFLSGPDYGWLRGSAPIRGLSLYYDYGAKRFYKLTGFQDPVAVLPAPFTSESVQLSFPLLGRSWFLNLQGILGKYAGDNGPDNPGVPGNSLPFIRITISGYNGDFNYPRIFDFNYNPLVFSNGGGSLPNMYQITTNGNNADARISATLNILEVIDDQVYNMQILRKFSTFN